MTSYPDRARHLVTSLVLIFTCFAIAQAAAAEKTAPPGIPPALAGFRGMMTGELIEKGGNTLVFKVTSIKKKWKANEAAHPEKAVGQRLRANLDHISDHHREAIMEHFRLLKPGDTLEVELFDLGERTLCVKEWLKKMGD